VSGGPGSTDLAGALAPPFSPNAASFEETERFLQAAAPEWKAFLVTALKTGLRVGELLALKWEDLDLVAGRLIVRRTLWHDQEGTPKGGRTREVPLSNEARSRDAYTLTSFTHVS
jgi:integrase